jgi:hypothetical protein
MGSTNEPGPVHSVGTLNEKPLHAALKQSYALPGDRIEVPVDGFIIDIVRGECLIEVQTRNVSAIRRKLAVLVETHPVRLIYPIAQEKWIVRQAEDGQSTLGRRKSPARGGPELVFRELVSIPGLLAHANFSLEVLLIREEEVRRTDGKGHRRRQGWTTAERRLIEVVDRRLFRTPAELAALLPRSLAEPFTARQLAAAIGQSPALGQKMAYCLRLLGILTIAGKAGNATLYTTNP